jgi:hypothetical protein
MEAVIAQMTQTRNELQREIEALDKMLEIYEKRHPEIKNVRPLRNDPHRARSGDKEAQKRLAAGTRKGGDKYPISQKVIDELLDGITRLVANGNSFVESIPGSFTTKQLSEETKRNSGTVRRGLAQLVESGQIIKADRMSWRQLGDTPQGATDVFVINSPGSRTRRLDESEKGRGWARVGNGQTQDR